MVTTKTIFQFGFQKRSHFPLLRDLSYIIGSMSELKVHSRVFSFFYSKKEKRLISTYQSCRNNESMKNYIFIFLIFIQIYSYKFIVTKYTPLRFGRIFLALFCAELYSFLA